MNFIKKYFEYKEMKTLIKRVTETIYSEHFDFDEILKNLLDQTGKLQALTAIKFACNINKPLNNEDIKQAIDELNCVYNNLKEKEEIKIYLKTLQESAEIDWQKRTKLIHEGKLAYKVNKHSYEAAIYHLEKRKKGPASSKEKEKWKKLSNDILEANQNLKNAKEELVNAKDELKRVQEEKSLKKAEEVINKMAAEIKERRKYMSDEEIQNEIEQAKINREEILKKLKETLKKN